MLLDAERCCCEMLLLRQFVHERHALCNLLCGAPCMQELDTCLVDICVCTAEPSAASTHTAVRCCTWQVLLLTHVLDLLNDAPRPVQLRAGKCKHQRSSWRTVFAGMVAKVATAAYAHCVRFSRRQAELSPCPAELYISELRNVSHCCVGQASRTEFHNASHCCVWRPSRTEFCIFI